MDLFRYLNLALTQGEDSLEDSLHDPNMPSHYDELHDDDLCIWCFLAELEHCVTQTAYDELRTDSTAILLDIAKEVGRICTEAIKVRNELGE